MKAPHSTPQDAIRRELGALPMPDRPLTDDQTRRILARACEKAGLPAPAPAPRQTVRAVHALPKARRARRKAVRTLAVAAAAVCACTVTVFAAGPALLKMLRGEISFFAAAPAATAETADPLEAPRGSYAGTQPQLEAYNSAVGQSIEHGGVTMTLDNVAMDVSGLDAFFTVQGNEAIEDLLHREGYEPDWEKVGGLFNLLYTSVNGDENALYNDQNDYYLDENGRLKIWAHYLLNTLPEGDEITVELKAQCNVGPEKDSLYGDWQPFTFTVSLDGASVRAGGRVAQAGEYDVGYTETIDPDAYRGLGYDAQIPEDAQAETINVPLRLDYLAFGPVSGTIAARVPNQEFWDYLVVDEGRSPDAFYITDDTGKELYSSCAAGYGVDQRRNLTAPDPAATAIVLTPVKLDWENAEANAEERTVTMEEMKNGAKIESSNLGGYTVQNFAIEDHAITYELVPYGWASAATALNIIPNDDDVITMVAETAELLNGEESQTVTLYHSGLMTETADPATGIITVRHDYYAATREEIERIPSFRYYYQGGYTLDTARALTLPLTAVE